MANVIEIIVKALDQASPVLSSVGTKLGTLGSQLTSLGTTMSKAVTVPIVAGFGLSVKAASDFEESVNKVAVVFGDASAEVLAFADNAAVGFGMSRQQAIDAMGTFGNLFTSMGIGVETSAEMSTSLVQLAADLASFNNIDPTLALEKLRAGLVGEVEPLRTLGVNLSAAAVEAKALEMGLIGAGDELTASVKAQAAYALILEQTTNAQGDFARTSDGLANATRILKAQLLDMAVQIGTYLLPAAKMLVDALSQLVTWFGTLSPGMQQTIVIIAAVAAAIGPLLIVVGALLSAIGAISTFLAGPLVASIGAALAAAAPVIAVIAAIIAVLGLLYLAWSTNFLGIQDITTVVIAFLVEQWNILVTNLQIVWNWITSNIFPLFQALGDLLSAVVGLAVRALAGLWQNVLLPALQTVANFISGKLSPVFQAISDFLGKVFAPVLSVVSGWIDKVKAAFNGLSNAIQSVISWIENLAAQINNLQLPDWLTPGSPTPFELGLRGINKELKSLSGMSLPEFQAALDIAQPTSGALGAAANISNINYNLTINEAGTRGNVINDFAIMQSLAGA